MTVVCIFIPVSYFFMHAHIKMLIRKSLGSFNSTYRSAFGGYAIELHVSCHALPAAGCVCYSSVMYGQQLALYALHVSCMCPACMVSSWLCMLCMCPACMVSSWLCMLCMCPACMHGQQLALYAIGSACVLHVWSAAGSVCYRLCMCPACMVSSWLCML